LNCYQNARAAIKRGDTTWGELEAKGLAAKATRGRGVLGNFAKALKAAQVDLPAGPVAAHTQHFLGPNIRPVEIVEEHDNLPPVEIPISKDELQYAVEAVGAVRSSGPAKITLSPVSQGPLAMQNVKIEQEPYEKILHDDEPASANPHGAQPNRAPSRQFVSTPNTKPNPFFGLLVDGSGIEQTAEDRETINGQRGQPAAPIPDETADFPPTVEKMKELRQRTPPRPTEITEAERAGARAAVDKARAIQGENEEYARERRCEAVAQELDNDFPFKGPCPTTQGIGAMVPPPTDPPEDASDKFGLNQGNLSEPAKGSPEGFVRRNGSGPIRPGSPIVPDKDGFVPKERILGLETMEIRMPADNPPVESQVDVTQPRPTVNGIGAMVPPPTDPPEDCGYVPESSTEPATAPVVVPEGDSYGDPWSGAFSADFGNGPTPTDPLRDAKVEKVMVDTQFEMPATSKPQVVYRAGVDPGDPSGSHSAEAKIELKPARGRKITPEELGEREPPKAKKPWEK
jgi:hypothetical protein